jgi:3-hydroxypropionyl-CoA synthetase (ADP-forming)
MDLLECLNFLKSSGIPVAETRVIKAKPDRFPIVLKANTLGHKTEKKLVRVVHCPGNFDREFSDLSKEGEVLGQEMASGIELILGIQSDETFGKVIMVGNGGVFTEVLKDVAFRAVPLTKKDAKDMIMELKIFDALKGFRGKTYNLEILEDALMKLSKIAEESNIKSLDINPFMLNDKKGVAVDCRMFMD